MQLKEIKSRRPVVAHTKRRHGVVARLNLDRPISRFQAHYAGHYLCVSVTMVRMTLFLFTSPPPRFTLSPRLSVLVAISRTLVLHTRAVHI